MAKLYYEPPSEEAFTEMQSAAMHIWHGYDLKHEKAARVNDMKNIGDNFMYIFAMFDMNNQRKVVSMVSEATKKEIRDRLVDGGSEWFIIKSIGL